MSKIMKNMKKFKWPIVGSPDDIKKQLSITNNPWAFCADDGVALNQGIDIFCFDHNNSKVFSMCNGVVEHVYNKGESSYIKISIAPEHTQQLDGKIKARYLNQACIIYKNISIDHSIKPGMQVTTETYLGSALNNPTSKRFKSIHIELDIVGCKHDPNALIVSSEGRS